MTEATGFVEREHKLDVDAAFVVPDLGILHDHGVMAKPRRPMILEATYYDSADLALFHAGIAIRRRVGGDDAGWHLKQYHGTPGERSEIRVPLSRGDGAVPTELIEQLPSALQHKLDLRPVLRLRTERTATELRDIAGQSVGELADDRVLAMRLEDGYASFWRELEIEEKGIDRSDALSYLERLLFGRGAKPSAHDSKLARGLDLSSRATGHQFDLLALRIRTQVAELVAREGDVRQRRDGGVHQMRVAVRRLRSCLRTFRPAFNEPVARRVGQQLKWLGDLLGAERDAEVIAGRMQRDLGELSSTDILGPVSMDLGVRSHDEIAAAHERLMQGLDSELYRRLLEELTAVVPIPVSGPSTPPRWLRSRVAKSAQQTIRLIKRADALSGTARATALHEVRKSAKHVRYTAETLVPLEGKRAEALAADFEALQTVLGEHHDAIVTQQRLRAEEGAHAGVRHNENGFTYGALFAIEAGRAATAEAKITPRAKRARRQAKWWLDK